MPTAIVLLFSIWSALILGGLALAVRYRRSPVLSTPPLTPTDRHTHDPTPKGTNPC